MSSEHSVGVSNTPWVCLTLQGFISAGHGGVQHSMDVFNTRAWVCPTLDQFYFCKILGRVGMAPELSRAVPHVVPICNASPAGFLPGYKGPSALTPNTLGLIPTLGALSPGPSRTRSSHELRSRRTHMDATDRTGSR